VSLISIPTSSWGSSLCIAFSAVYGSALVWFERNLTFLSTFGTDCIVHFSLFSIRHSDCTSYSLKELVSSEHQFWNANLRVAYKLMRASILHACNGQTGEDVTSKKGRTFSFFLRSALCATSVLSGEEEIRSKGETSWLILSNCS
jgi:hypothetical protein